MKHIAIFTQNLDVGGVQKSVVNLANFLIKYYKIYIILAEDNKPIKYKLNKQIKIYKIKTKKIDISKKYAGFKVLTYRINKLEQFLKKIKPNIIFSFEDYNNYIVMKTRYKALKIYSVRVHDDIYKGKKIHLLEEKFYKNIDYKKVKTIVVSKAINIKNAKIITNGVEKPQNIKQKENNYILNVGRLHPQKGQIDLIKAYNLIKDKIKQDLIIVGDGVLKDKLHNIVEELQLENRVKFIGFDNPHKYYKNASLFVFSSYYEGSPNALLEAMSYKLPIVCYDFKGSEEVMDKRIKVGDIKALANEMLNNLDKKQNYKIKSLHKSLREYKRLIDVWNSRM